MGPRESERLCVMKYYEGFQMQFSVGEYTHYGWIWRLVFLWDVLFPQSCSFWLWEISQRLLRDLGLEYHFSEGKKLPPIHAFVDDSTLPCPSTEAVMNILTKLDELMRIKFKTKKSRSLVLRKGKPVDIHLMLCSDEIPSEKVLGSGIRMVTAKDGELRVNWEMWFAGRAETLVPTIWPYV